MGGTPCPRQVITQLTGDGQIGLLVFSALIKIKGLFHLLINSRIHLCRPTEKLSHDRFINVSYLTVLCSVSSAGSVKTVGRCVSDTLFVFCEGTDGSLT